MRGISFTLKLRWTTIGGRYAITMNINDKGNANAMIRNESSTASIVAGQVGMRGKIVDFINSRITVGKVL